MTRYAHQLFVPACVLGVLAAPAQAGGWATVQFDETPGPLIRDPPWRFGFTVFQHDVNPTSDVTSRVLARHLKSGEMIRAGAEQEGEVGPFVSGPSSPLLGVWKFSITPEPSGATSVGRWEVVTGAGQPPPIEAVDDGFDLLVDVRLGRSESLSEPVGTLAEEGMSARS